MKKIVIVQAVIGLLVWLVTLFLLQLPIVERLLLFAMFVVVPLALSLTETKYRDGTYFKTYVTCVYLYPAAVILAFLSFLFPPGLLAGVLALGWLIWTGLVFLFGLQRLLARGFYIIEEVSIDIGLMYLILGGAWFTIFQFGLDVMGFGALIILLTAIHFHFSAFITPIFAGLLGRVIRQSAAPMPMSYQVATIGIMISSLGIALGITYSRVIEFSFVLIFVSCLWIYTYLIVVTHRKRIVNKIAYTLLAISSITLLFTMTLSIYYGLGRLLNLTLITIPDMVWLHGIGNAFGFVFLGVIGWLLLSPKMHRSCYGVSFSKIYGKTKIGSNFFDRHNYRDKKNSCHGLVESIDCFEQGHFQPNKVHGDIKGFYENTVNYEMKSSTTWHFGFQTLSFVYNQISSTIEQLNIPRNEPDEEFVVDNQILAIDSKKDGREKVRAWVRTSRKTGKAVFVAAYSYHQYEGNKYLNIALPLPLGQMTGVLRFENPSSGDGMVLTSFGKENNKGDEGIYFVTRWFSVRLPLSEHFIIEVPNSSENQITAKHEMWLLGIRFLSINYLIEKRTT
ncbi:YndJ family protein [Bacillus alkalicellulosilyticus]|uniref:YndJ family protein n=1 Tax=Alkalihalobacterium alkalicellulosilyticum TaxID=1912214 RepID=UPI000998BCE5|nr:YndJ family protein [Bacillus alkalicellulosilyticus]